MTTITESPTIDEKLDALAEQVSAIASEIEAARRRRTVRDELRESLTPVATEAYTMAARELEAMQADGSVDALLRLLKRLVASAGSLDGAVASLEMAASFMSDAAPLSGEALAALTSRLTDVDRKGYFEFARHSAGVLDRVVTSFDGDDIDQLGDNVVLILKTVKEMTQPEVMGMLRRTATAMQSQQHVIENGSEDTPSLLQIMRQMRQPEVRRGLSRALSMLRVVASEDSDPTDQDTKGDG